MGFFIRGFYSPHLSFFLIFLDADTYTVPPPPPPVHVFDSHYSQSVVTVEKTKSEKTKSDGRGGLFLVAGYLHRGSVFRCDLRFCFF